MSPPKAILLDPGHGGEDLGTTWPLVKFSDTYELVEKTITLQLARRLREALLATEWPIAVELTRDEDEYLSLHGRGVLGQKYGADLVLSLHVNSSPEPQHSGMITFARAGDALGEAVARVITGAAPPELRRKVNTFFSCDPLGIATDPGKAWLSRCENVLRHYAPVASVVVETAHMTNEGDRGELQRDGVQAGIVSACVLGVGHWLASSAVA